MYGTLWVLAYWMSLRSLGGGWSMLDGGAGSVDRLREALHGYDLVGGESFGGQQTIRHMLDPSIWNSLLPTVDLRFVSRAACAEVFSRKLGRIGGSPVPSERTPDNHSYDKAASARSSS